MHQISDCFVYSILLLLPVFRSVRSQSVSHTPECGRRQRRTQPKMGIFCRGARASELLTRHWHRGIWVTIQLTKYPTEYPSPKSHFGKETCIKYNKRVLFGHEFGRIFGRIFCCQLNCHPFMPWVTLCSVLFPFLYLPLEYSWPLNVHWIPGPGSL